MIGLVLLAGFALQSSAKTPLQPLPIRGLHLSAPSPNGLPAFEKFIREDLPKEGVNTLLLEFDYGFHSDLHPEVGDGPLTKAQIGDLATACESVHIRLIPQINLLGHQSWAAHTDQLLTAHPEFDETRGKYPGNKGIYCRSYCPLAPGLHTVVFDLIDELADACRATAVHVGMDEVFILCDKDCPRCHGKATADVFAGEVTALHDHLKSKGREMWMWGDRYLDGRSNGLGEWEASTNGTQSAIDMVPKDIVICDWHYDNAEPTAAYFALHGFRVLSCPWRKTSVALGELSMVQSIRQNANPDIAKNCVGMLHTTWCGANDFVDAYHGKTVRSGQTRETAQCFKDLFAAMR
jgi:glycosyl hydrolase family 20